ncbi:MAG: hypothetical protein R3A49_06280 [Acidimicrobiia bacterium]
MAVDERTRLALARKLDAVLGTDDASTLMEYLPPVGWAAIATKQDLAALEQSLRGEIVGLRGEVRGEIAELRGEMHREIGGLRGEIGGLRVELADALRAQTNRILGWVVPTMLAGVGIAVAATNLG